MVVKISLDDYQVNNVRSECGCLKWIPFGSECVLSDGLLLSLNIPSLARQRCLPSWGPRRTPWFFFVVSQRFDAVDYSNYVFWVSETIIQ